MIEFLIMVVSAVGLWLWYRPIALDAARVPRTANDWLVTLRIRPGLFASRRNLTAVYTHAWQCGYAFWGSSGIRCSLSTEKACALAVDLAKVQHAQERRAESFHKLIMEEAARLSA